jgi:archaeosine-15-forming tRNA-guanine transglycosylase
MNSVENVVIDNDDVVVVEEDDSWIGVWRKIC